MIKNMSSSKNKKLEPHIIMHLKITQEDIDSFIKNRIHTGPVEKNMNNVPEPYDINNSIPGQSFINKKNSTTIDNVLYENINIDYKIETKCENKNIPNIDMDTIEGKIDNNLLSDNTNSDVKMKVIKTMFEFSDANRRNEWVSNTSIWCGWDSHPFNGPPVSIPKFYINKTFFVTGCYCSYSCAAKHLFSRSDITESDKLKFYSLLHFLKTKITGNMSKIIHAPPKETLIVFGGHLSIEEFRSITNDTHEYYKIFNILEPPMVSIIPVIEETITSNDIQNKLYNKQIYAVPKTEKYNHSSWEENKPFIPLDSSRLKRAAENLKLKRKEPVLDKKKTLLNYMNLKINNSNE